MTARAKPLSKRARVAISILVAFHLLGVLLPPLAFQTRPSPSVATAIAPLEGYSQLLYIDRGYAFFAPDPGPSHLFQAAITDADGQIVEEVYPDLDQQWPRLLYHRHFMLAEFLQTMYQPPGPPEELVEVDPDEAEMWVRTRARYEHIRQSVVEHLKHVNPGCEVAILRLEHLIPNVVEYQQDPIALSDRRLYRVLPDQPVSMPSDGDLAAPIGPPETIPSPAGVAGEEAAETESADQQQAVEATADNQDAEKESGESDDPPAEQPAAVKAEQADLTGDSR